MSASSPPTCAESTSRFCGRTHTCPPRLRHHVQRTLRASAGGTQICVCLVSTMCGECGTRLWATNASVRSVPSIMCGQRRHSLVPRSCAESDSRSCRRHTHVSASSPTQCAESVARFCWRHTHVSAPSLRQRAESAARSCRWHTQCHACARLVSAIMCGERCSLLRAAHECSPMWELGPGSSGVGMHFAGTRPGRNAFPIPTRE